MKLSGNTILITGGGSGIGLALAESFLEKQNKVIIVGRNEEKLQKAKLKNPKLDYYICDVSNDAEVEVMYKNVIKIYPQLNFLINNAGQMHWFDVQKEKSVDYAKQKGEIMTNYWATVHLCQRFIPHLLQQPQAAIMNISSGIAFTPMPAVAVYSGTKAAVHFYTQSLNWQLKNTNIKVYEVLPPGVHTEMVKGMDLNMPMITTDKLVKDILKGLSAKNGGEIKPGMSGMVKQMVRFIPGVVNFMMQYESKKLLQKL